MDKVLEYCTRGIIQYLNGDYEKFNNYKQRAIKINELMCKCGGHRIKARYGKRAAMLCTECGRIYIDNKVVRKCLNSRRVS